MNTPNSTTVTPANQVTETLQHASRESLLHALYEAAELEHNVMCTYLYAAFSLKSGTSEGLSTSEAEALARWRSELISVAIDEMSHLVAVWNVTSALGGVPRFGRGNFPIEVGYLPAAIVLKLQRFTPETLQHFIFLERPVDSSETDGTGFVPQHLFSRNTTTKYVTPMAIDYPTIGEFYLTLKNGLHGLVERVGESKSFIGDPALQLSQREVELPGSIAVQCLKTALAAFDEIILEGEGAPQHSDNSHYSRFLKIRQEYQTLKAANPNFDASYAAATNPVLRPPPEPEGHVWIENQAAIAVVDLANAAYGLMLRLLGLAYSIPSPQADKALVIDLALGLMRAVTPLGELAARLPAGASHPDCNAGMSFTALRDAGALPEGLAAKQFMLERLAELADAATRIASEQKTLATDTRFQNATTILNSLAAKASKRFDLNVAPTSHTTNIAAEVSPANIVTAHANDTATANLDSNETTSTANGIETVQGKNLVLKYEAKRCIHARVCVTGAPTVFLANVKGPWLHPNTLDTEELVGIAHQCPSGAIQYERTDGRPNEMLPPVNLASVREGGPYALRGDIQLDGVAIGYRATLCRCGASKNKPFCDSSHHEIGFTATGEPSTVDALSTMLPERGETLAIDPELNGPLHIRGNLEITSGTGRMVARTTSTKLCRCGHSANKPFCDGTHAVIGFKSE